MADSQHLVEQEHEFHGFARHSIILLRLEGVNWCSGHMQKEKTPVNTPSDMSP